MRTSYWRYVWLRNPLPKVDERITRAPAKGLGDGEAGDSGKADPPTWSQPAAQDDPGAGGPPDDAPEADDDVDWDGVFGDDPE
jgi:hypothetical protein